MFSSPIDRRRFVVRSAQAGMLAGLADFAFLDNLPAAAAQNQGADNRVRFHADIEPYVRLLEDSPRDRLLETVGERVRAGTANYHDLYAALLLAGVRSIKPRPVGFQFHAVLVTNSAHMASLAARDQDRWLPLFWALDNFKAQQARGQRENGWIMPAINEGQVPGQAVARRRFMEAMDNWDEEAADRAICGFVRTAGASEVIETFWRYGCRDFRDIGHKAIYVANAWRTLQTIGWRHAEPVMRSLAFALLAHEGANPAGRSAEQDVPYRENLQKVRRIRADWQRGRISSEATTDLLATLRTATAAETCDRVVAQLNQSIDPTSLWDALFLGAGELLMRNPSIVGIHCVTSVNALHFGYQTSGNDETRQLLLLQAAAFLPLFLRNMQRGGRLPDLRIDRLEPMDLRARGPEAIEEIFADVSNNRTTAARKTLALMRAENGPGAPALMTAARRLIFAKGQDSHDYKFSSAALEDFFHTSPAWRNHFLATTMFNLKGSRGNDTQLYTRTRNALAAR